MSALFNFGFWVGSIKEAGLADIARQGLTAAGGALRSYGSALTGQAASAARKSLPGLRQNALTASSKQKSLGRNVFYKDPITQKTVNHTNDVYRPAQQAFTNAQGLTQNLEFNRDLARGLTGAGAVAAGGAYALNK